MASSVYDQYDSVVKEAAAAYSSRGNGTYVSAAPDRKDPPKSTIRAREPRFFMDPATAPVSRTLANTGYMVADSTIGATTRTAISLADEQRRDRFIGSIVDNPNPFDNPNASDALGAALVVAGPVAGTVRSGMATVVDALPKTMRPGIVRVPARSAGGAAAGKAAAGKAAAGKAAAGKAAAGEAASKVEKPEFLSRDRLKRFMALKKESARIQKPKLKDVRNSKIAEQMNIAAESGKSAQSSAVAMEKGFQTAAKEAWEYTVWSSVPRFARNAWGKMSGFFRGAAHVAENSTGAAYRMWTQPGRKVMGRVFGTGKPTPMLVRNGGKGIYRPWQAPVTKLDAIKEAGAFFLGGPGFSAFTAAAVAAPVAYGAYRLYSSRNKEASEKAGEGIQPGDGDRAIRDMNTNSVPASPTWSSADLGNSVIDKAMAQFAVDRDEERLSRSISAVDPGIVSNRVDRARSLGFASTYNMDRGDAESMSPDDFRYQRVQSMIKDYDDKFNGLPLSQRLSIPDGR